MARRRHKFKSVPKSFCFAAALGMVISFQVVANRLDSFTSYSPQELAEMGPVVPSGEAKWFVDFDNTNNRFGGTITYYDPNNGSPGTFALGSMGHGIDGVGYDQALHIVGVEATVHGTSGGNLQIMDLDEGWISLDRNTNVGAFGETLQPELVDTKKAMGVAWPKVGPAQVLTTVDEKGPQYHDIMITEVKENDVTPYSSHSDFEFTFVNGPGSAGGMSGSPIIQDGKLVGALSAAIERDNSIAFGVSAADMITAQKKVMDGKQPKMSVRKLMANNKGFIKFLWLLSAAGLTIPLLKPFYKKLGNKIVDKVMGDMMDEPDR